MEIILENKDRSISLNSDNIIGINKKISVSKLINSKYSIKIDKQKKSKKELNDYKKFISYIEENPNFIPFKSNIYEIMYYEIRSKNIILNNPAKKMKDSLKIVGLNKDYLERNLHNLSTSEKKLFQLSLSLLSNPNILILEEPFKYLDFDKKKKLMILLKKMKDDYNKTIIIISNNSNILYKYTDKVLLYRNNKLLIEGKSKEIFENISFLEKNNIELPESILFTKKAIDKKNVNMDYHRDIRDLIKDIYKHV